MTNFEWLKTLSVEELSRTLTELSAYYEEHVDDKALFAGPSGWQMSREEAEKDYKKWLEEAHSGTFWSDLLK